MKKWGETGFPLSGWAHSIPHFELQAAWRAQRPKPCRNETSSPSLRRRILQLLPFAPPDTPSFPFQPGLPLRWYCAIQLPAPYLSLGHHKPPNPTLAPTPIGLRGPCTRGSKALSCSLSRMLIFRRPLFWFFATGPDAERVKSMAQGLTVLLEKLVGFFVPEATCFLE